jgi:hypothetical protein
VLGKLGQALFECAIYARPDTDSRIYYTTKQYDYIVVKPAPEKVWRRVLLQNGDYGYIEADLIAELPYQVLAPKAAPGDVQGPASLARRAIDAIGTPYKAGGRSLKKGIDSGGFVQQVFRTHGIKLPADPSRQVELGRAVSRLEDLAPGDRLYFWSDRKNRVAAAGIYIGKGTFVAAWPGRAVASAYLGEKKYLDKLVAARR